MQEESKTLQNAAKLLLLDSGRGVRVFVVGKCGSSGLEV